MSFTRIAIAFQCLSVLATALPAVALSEQQKAPMQGFFYGRYWARTSDPQLVDSEQRADQCVTVRSKRHRCAEFAHERTG